MSVSTSTCSPTGGGRQSLPFLAVSAVMTDGVAVALLDSQRRRRSVLLLTAGVASGAVVGSAIAAAASFGLAGVGAGLGLLRTVAVLRAVLRNPNLTLFYSIKNDR